jgi:hypothetical protein
LVRRYSSTTKSGDQLNKPLDGKLKGGTHELRSRLSEIHGGVFVNNSAAEYGGMACLWPASGAISPRHARQIRRRRRSAAPSEVRMRNTAAVEPHAKQTLLPVTLASAQRSFAPHAPFQLPPQLPRSSLRLGLQAEGCQGIALLGRFRFFFFFIILLRFSRFFRVSRAALCITFVFSQSFCFSVCRSF